MRTSLTAILSPALTPMSVQPALAAAGLVAFAGVAGVAALMLVVTVRPAAERPAARNPAAAAAMVRMAV
ncbi:MAG: hypothetical protein ACYCO9_04415 [Streptosporangiaceae bacterium]